jgi:hypothetical protein
MEPRTPGRVTDHEDKHELKATLEARRELGPEMEDHLVEAFLAKVQSRVDAQLATQAKDAKKQVSRGTRHEGVSVEMIAAPMALAIPLVAIAGGIAGKIGIIAVIFGLVAIELLYFIDRWVRFNMQ